MKALSWQVHVDFTFRPLLLLWRLFGVAVVLLVFLVPPTVREAPVKTIDQLSRENAHASVDSILGERMVYLDHARREALGRVIVDESLSCGLDPLFVLAVSDVESRLDHEAVSPTGARGLFQVIPSTWTHEVKRRGLGRLEKFNVVHNAKVGIGYLCALSRQFKRPDALLLAYNQGPGGAARILFGRMEPTREASTYASKVWKSYRGFLARNNLPSDPKSMRQLYARPEATIFTPLPGYSSDVHGPDPQPPQKPKVKPKPRPRPRPAMAPGTSASGTGVTVIDAMPWAPPGGIDVIGTR